MTNQYKRESIIIAGVGKWFLEVNIYEKNLYFQLQNSADGNERKLITILNAMVRDHVSWSM